MERLVAVEISIFMILDDESRAPGFERNDGGFTFVSISSSDSLQYGYYMLSFLQPNPVHAWDKALFFFSRIMFGRYKFVWFFENDVYIRSVNSFVKVHSEALNCQHNLVIKSNHIETNPNLATWHWPTISKTFAVPTPWYISTACAMGLSKRIMRAVDEYAQNNTRLELLETFFNTLSMHGNLSVWNPKAMETIDCCRTPPPLGIAMIMTAINTSGFIRSKTFVVLLVNAIYSRQAG